MALTSPAARAQSSIRSPISRRTDSCLAGARVLQQCVSPVHIQSPGHKSMSATPAVPWDLCREAMGGASSSVNWVLGAAARPGPGPGGTDGETASNSARGTAAARRERGQRRRVGRWFWTGSVQAHFSQNVRLKVSEKCCAEIEYTHTHTHTQAHTHARTRAHT